MLRSERSITRLQITVQDLEFIARHRNCPTAFTRKRKLPFAIVVGTILHLAKKSLQIECNLLGDRLMTEPASKQAFSKARHKISYTGFKALNEEFLREAYINDDTGTWFGFRVFGIDGSTARLPWSKELEEYFGQYDRGADRNDNCPIVARISEVFELTTGIAVNAEIAPWSFGERCLAKDQIKAVTRFFQDLGQPKQLFVFDRGYASKEMMRLILNSKADFMFRMPKSYNVKIDQLANLGDGDHLLQLSEDLPTFRLIVRNLTSGEQCVLLTSLTDKEVSADCFFRLYWLRWTGCEEGYKKQKIQLELENFSGCSMESVMQEFWATVLAMNIFLLQCVDKEGPWDPEAPPEYRINRNVVFGSLRDSIFSAIIGEISAAQLNEKFQQIAKRSKIKIVPDRKFSRDKVGKPKRYHVYRRTC